MAILHHHVLDPLSRRIRLALGEYGVAHDLVEEQPGFASSELATINPAAEVPVLIEDDGLILCGASVISEYLDETRAGERGLQLIGRSPAERAETRRLIAWFDERFNAEVTHPVVGEKAIRRFLPREVGGGPPDMPRLRAGIAALRGHLNYMAGLAEHRNWLAGSEFSAADLAAAAHLSCLDFIGEVPWEEAPEVKHWYQRVKSRPSFRTLLGDHVRGISPPVSYSDLDF